MRRALLVIETTEMPNAKVILNKISVLLTAIEGRTER